MDLSDYADIEIENYHAHMRRHKSAIKANSIKPEGYCHNCFEDLEEGKLYCNDNCARQHEYTAKIRR